MNDKFANHLLVTDIDGTLAVGSYVNPANYGAIRRFCDAGGTVALATGRTPQSAVPVAREMAAGSLLICNNGASIYNCYTGDVIWESIYDFSFEAKFVADNFPNVGVMAYYRDKLKLLNDNYYISRLVENEHLVLEPDHSTVANKLLFGASDSELKLLENACNKNFDFENVQIVRADLNYLELLPCGVTKGLSMLRLADLLSVPHDRIYAAGNYYNDVEMLDFARYSCVPCESPDDVASHADLIACRCEDGAIAEFIDWLFDKV